MLLRALRPTTLLDMLLTVFAYLVPLELLLRIQQLHLKTTAEQVGVIVLQNS
jgi:hypothetical protein